MTASRYIVKVTSLFRKDYKRAMKRGLNVTLLEHVVGGAREWKASARKK